MLGPGRIPYLQKKHIDIRQFKPSLVNIVQVALVSDTLGWRGLKELAADLEDAIEIVPGVRRAQSWAYPEPEIRVAVDLDCAVAGAYHDGETARPIPSSEEIVRELERCEKTADA